MLHENWYIPTGYSCRENCNNDGARRFMTFYGFVGNFKIYPGRLFDNFGKQAMFLPGMIKVGGRRKARAGRERQEVIGAQYQLPFNSYNQSGIQYWIFSCLVMVGLICATVVKKGFPGKTNVKERVNLLKYLN